MYIKKLTDIESIFNTPILVQNILYYAKKHDCTYFSPAAKLFKHLHFIYKKRIVVIDKFNNNYIIFPKKFKIYRYNI